MNKKKVALDIVKSVFRFLFLAGLSVIIVYPFFYSLSVAVRDVQDLYDPLVILVPRHFTRENITNVMERMDYVDSLFGSFFRDGVSCLLQIASCSLTGYGLARFNFKGKKIVSGGTTAQIVSRLLGKKLTLDLSSWSKDVPPASKMEGIDLVTEGMLTLSKVASILEKKLNPAELPNDPAKKFVEMLLNSDQVHFIVGTKINEAHQDPNIPVEIGIRRTIIGRLRKALEEIYLKETSQEYL